MPTELAIQFLKENERIQDQALLEALGLMPIPILKPDEKRMETVMLHEGEKKERLAEIVYWRRGEKVLNITEKNGDCLYQRPFYWVRLRKYKGRDEFFESRILIDIISTEAKTKKRKA